MLLNHTAHHPLTGFKRTFEAFSRCAFSSHHTGFSLTNRSKNNSDEFYNGLKIFFRGTKHSHSSSERVPLISPDHQQQGWILLGGCCRRENEIKVRRQQETRERERVMLVTNSYCHSPCCCSSEWRMSPQQLHLSQLVFHSSHYGICSGMGL